MTIYSGACGENATWRLEDDGTLYVEGTGAMEDYSSYSENPLYSNRGSVKIAIVSEGISHIGNYAMNNFYAMTSLNLPSTLESIGEHAFKGCQLLEGLFIPENLNYIGAYAFWECKKITTLNLKNVQYIGYGAFYSCESLESDIDLSGIKSLEDFTFNGCVKISNVILSSALTSIGKYSFQKCVMLKEIELPEGVKNIPAGAFNGCGLISIDLRYVETVEVDAFHDCYNLQTIIFGKNLTSIGNYAFMRTYSSNGAAQDRVIRDFFFYGPKPSFGTYSVGYYRYGSSSYSYVVDSSVGHTSGFSKVDANNYLLGFYLIGFGENITHVVDGDTLTLSGSGEMYTPESDCKPPIGTGSCTKLYIGPNISINSSMMALFKSKLVLLSAPYLESVGDSIFQSYTKLEYVDISDAISIGNLAFSSCTVLGKVIMKKARTIGDSAFSGCPLRGIILPETLETIGKNAFNGNVAYSVIVPKNVTSIGNNAFATSSRYREHFVIVFRGQYIASTFSASATSTLMVFEFCKNEPEYIRNDPYYDYTPMQVNSAHPVMIRTPGGWRVISTDMIDNT